MYSRHISHYVFYWFQVVVRRLMVCVYIYLATVEDLCWPCILIIILKPHSMLTLFSPSPKTLKLNLLPLVIRHVVLPREMAKYVPRLHLMSEDEWRQLGVQQSQGWIHYMIHEPGSGCNNLSHTHHVVVLVLKCCSFS